MNAWEFASANPLTTALVVLVVVLAIEHILCWPFRLVNRWIRHRNIVAKGWPPVHLDADGDWRRIES